MRRRSKVVGGPKNSKVFKGVALGRSVVPYLPVKKDYAFNER